MLITLLHQIVEGPTEMRCLHIQNYLRHRMILRRNTSRGAASTPFRRRQTIERGLLRL
jgi:hypothetical protein